MKLTRRGYAVLCVVVVAVSLAQAFTPRALNAVAAPLVIALVVGAIQVRRASEISMTVDGGRPGFPDERRTRQLTIEGSGLARIHAPVATGLSGEVAETLETLPVRIDQTYTLRDRGIVAHPPISIVQRDSLGLVATTQTVDPDDTQTVYPATVDVGRFRAPGVFGDNRGHGRQAFDSLREYVPGDPLRDVHWKTSAKYDDFLVMEFGAEEFRETVTIAGIAESGRADGMASVTASIALRVLEAGRPVSVVVSDGTVEAGKGDEQRTAVLELLARTDGGSVSTEAVENADVVVRSTDEETTVRVGERTVGLGSPHDRGGGVPA